MDISKYISELLYEHDCVIIPGFGGFICNYKPAEIHPVLHTISPPVKAISFNKNLRNNDGLLLNYITTREKILFDEAFDGIYSWVGSANSLLQKGEDVILKNIGKFCNNVEGHLQFTPDDSVNYLKSSFGLQTITVQPVLRAKTISISGGVKRPTLEIKSQRNIWRIAASVFLIASLSSLITAMQLGVEVKALQLDEASVFGFINNILKIHEPELKPIPVETKAQPIEEATAEKLPVAVPEATTVHEAGEQYYIIIGAFAKKRNVEIAKNNLLQTQPEKNVFIEQGNRLTRVGYWAGNNMEAANELLTKAQRQNETYWLLKK